MLTYIQYPVYNNTEDFLLKPYQLTKSFLFTYLIPAFSRNSNNLIASHMYKHIMFARIPAYIFSLLFGLQVSLSPFGYGSMHLKLIYCILLLSFVAPLQYSSELLLEYLHKTQSIMMLGIINEYIDFQGKFFYYNRISSILEPSILGV